MNKQDIQRILRNVCCAASMFIAFSCDDYVDQFDIDYELSDVKTIEYTLVTSDYATVATNETNQALALEKDPEGQTYVDALNAVQTNKCFSSLAPADEYLPAFIETKWPNASEGSTFTITYANEKTTSEYLDYFSNLDDYTLTADDYESVWGSTVDASFLSPSTIDEIPDILASSLSDAATGTMIQVNYAYSQTEPSIGGSSSSSSEEPTWTQLEFLNRATGSDWNFTNIGPIDLSDYIGETVNIGFRYASSTSAAATWEIKNFKLFTTQYMDVLLFAEQTDGTYQKIVKSSGFTGDGNYVIAAMGTDGNYYPFGRLTSDSNTYGYMYPSALTVTDGVITADDAADFVLAIAASDNGYTIMNALGYYIYQSGTYNSFNLSEEITDDDSYGYEWEIENAGSDLFTITNVLKEKTIKLICYSGSFSYGCYSESTIETYTPYDNSLLGDEGDFETYDVEIDDALSYVWTNTSSYGWKGSAYYNSTYYATESFLVSPAFELSEDTYTYPAFTADEAHRYAGDADEDLTIWISTDYSTATKSLKLKSSSSVTPNASAIYYYDGSTWEEYTNDDVLISVVQPSDYDQIGAEYIASPSTILPIYLANEFPYAESDAIAAVVYYSSSAGALSVGEFIYDGASWSEYTNTTESLKFTFDGTEVSANMSTYFSNSLLGDEGNMVAYDVLLSGGLSYVWTNTSSYGWKGSAYLNSTYNPAESWLVTPAMKFTKAVAPYMTYQEAYRYCDSADDYLTVYASTDFSGDVEAATWEQLTITGRGDGADWTYYQIDNVDLSAYCGYSSVVIGFRYTSDSTNAATWEIKNLEICELE